MFALWFGLAAGAVLGLLGLIIPNQILAFVGLTPATAEGLADGRATYGGYLSAEVCAAAIWLRTGATHGLLILGLAWAGAAFGRVLSLAVDGGRTPRNVKAIIFELGIGLMHLAPCA